ncbi:hypothetical protein [Brevibacillus choshinensis]|uniref:Uncharacterized protein n=1 Tax=Brevibacillus choshinensis TaxID=54911 RepID=A0ABX7FMC5_BRECH|nr:hypothetical protein [Brevibacillus choshinensis]QRG66807.1 hypothetical protein JNE38_25540 [Brevibacillus choshinensis]
MRFTRKKVPLGNKIVTVLVPKQVPKQLWFAEPILSTRAVLGDAHGFAFLSQLFLTAVKCEIPHALFYVPRPPVNEHTPRNGYNLGRYDLDLVLFHFHSLQIRSKDVKRVIHSLSFLPGEEIHLEADLSLLHSYLESYNHWNLKNQLTSKSYSKYVSVSGNSDILLYLAYLAYRFQGVEHDERSNFHLHSHADTIGTSPENGLDFYYYHDPLLPN